MGKKGSWFSAIKRAFTHNSKEKRADEPDKKSGSKEKKKGKGILRHGENKSFIPLFREPSSIEKILGEADQLLIRPHTPLERPKSPPALPIRPVSPKVASPKAASSRPFSPKASSPKAPSPRAVSPKVASPRAVSTKDALPRTSSTGPLSSKAAPSRTFSTEAISPKAAPSRTSSTDDVSPKAAPPKPVDTVASSSKAAIPKVTKSKKETRYVQRPELTLTEKQLSATKIQAAYRGYLARRSFRALKGLVRLQGVVKGQNVKRQTANAMKQMQLLVRVQTQIQSRRIHMLENQALQHQAYKTEKDAESTLSKLTNQLTESGHNEDWDDSSLTKEEVEARLRKKVEAVIKRERAMAYAYSHQLWKSTPKSAQNPLETRSNRFPWWWNWLERQLPHVGPSQSQSTTRNIASTPPRTLPSPRPHLHADSINHDSVTPRSSRSALPFRAKQFQTTPNRSPLASSSSFAKKSALKDDDSLVSCPPFSVPNYMASTVSAKAKSRANSNPRERFPVTGGGDSKRRFSFPLTSNAGSFKGSVRDSASVRGVERRDDSRSIGDLSVDSTVSMPAGLVGRRPFNRFV